MMERLDVKYLVAERRSGSGACFKLAICMSRTMNANAMDEWITKNTNMRIRSFSKRKHNKTLMTVTVQFKLFGMPQFIYEPNLFIT